MAQDYPYEPFRFLAVLTRLMVANCRPSVRSVVRAMAVLIAAVSCSPSNSNDAICTSGESIQCTSTNGCIGTQVCNSDGATYGECACGYSYNTGGSGSAGGSSTNSGGIITGNGGSANGYAPSGGRLSNATGGRASGLAGGPGVLATGGDPNCIPSDMSGQSYPPYIPARHMAGSCTEQALAQYYTDCYEGNSCSAFVLGGTEELCGACLAPSAVNSSAYGPLLELGSGPLHALEPNVAGCEEILGESSCAPAMQQEFLCEYGACVDNCPISDSSSFNDLFICMSNALAGTCASQHAAAQCIKDAGNVSACIASGFQAQFIAVAKVFCL